MLSDVLDRVLSVVDPDVGQQRSSYLIVEPRKEEGCRSIVASTMSNPNVVVHLK